MDCPRCGAELDRYTLGGREAVGCAGCGYVGVPVEHRGEQRRVESWEEAIDRFAEAARRGSVSVEMIDEKPALELVLDSDPDTSVPTPSVVRVDESDPALVAAFQVADDAGADHVCSICDAAFDSQSELYGHLAVHSGEKRRNR